MSFILEALKKSERERKAGKVPDLSSVVHEPRRRPVPWLLLTLVVLGVVNALGLGYWLYQGQAPDRPLQAESVSPKEPPLLSHEVTKDPPVPKLSGSSQDVPAPVSKALPPTYPSERANGTPSAESVPSPWRADVPLLRAPVPEPEDERVDAELEAEGVDPSPPSALLRRQEGHYPLAGELPFEIRQKLPSFRITMFAFDEQPKERFVIVNMKKLKVGDLLPGGILIIDIRAEDLVAEIDGQKFRIPRY